MKARKTGVRLYSRELIDRQAVLLRRAEHAANDVTLRRPDLQQTDLVKELFIR